MPEDVQDELTLEQKHQARRDKMTRMARELKHWTDRQKLHVFQRYEFINLKTLRCRN